MKTNKQFIIVISILLAALAVSVPAYLAVPSAKEESSVSQMPMQIGDWQGRDLPIDERSYEILETRNLILREYSKGNEKVYLYIIYSQDNRKVSHPPEVCFEGSGITVVKKDKVQLDLAGNRSITANRLFVEKQGVNNVVVYWYKAGKKYFDNYLKQQFSIALSAIRFRRGSGAMIRLSAEVLGSDMDRTSRNIQAFANAASVYFEQIIP